SGLDGRRHPGAVEGAERQVRDHRLREERLQHAAVHGRRRRRGPARQRVPGDQRRQWALPAEPVRAEPAAHLRRRSPLQVLLTRALGLNGKGAFLAERALFLCPFAAAGPENRWRRRRLSFHTSCNEKKQERSTRECVRDESLRRGHQGAAGRAPTARIEVAAMSAEAAPMPRLGWPTKALYGLSAFGTTLKVGQGLTLFFYTQLVGLDAPLVSLALSIALFIDAFWDPVVGQISDNTHT